MNNLRRRALSSSGETGRGTIGDYEFVDLGLPSGLLWATCNVGANSETDYGNYYKYGKGSQTYTFDGYYNYYRGTEDPLASSADTATQVMGEGWRMPTTNECRELCSNTDYEWTTINGINGGKFTSKTNPNAYVFFPAAGQFQGNKINLKGSYSLVWSSNPRSSDSAYFFYANSSEAFYYYTNPRGNGNSVRGVHAAV